MSRRKAGVHANTRPNTPPPATRMDNSKPQEKLMMNNGLTDVLGFDHNLLPTGRMGSQLSQLDTLYSNMRWYLVSNARQLLSQFYVEHGLVQTIVDLPVDDAFRGGIEIKSEQLSEEDVKKLKHKIEAADDLGVFMQGKKWARLFGGAGVIVITSQKSHLPLDLTLIGPKSFVEFKEFDMWELQGGSIADEVDERALQHDEEEEDLLTVGSAQESVPVEKLGYKPGRDGCYDYYGQRVHKSRVRLFKGAKAPSFIKPRLKGWGFSIVEAIVRSVNQYLKSTNLTFEVLDEFKLDIFKIKGLKDALMSTAGEVNVKKRIALANSEKNYNHALTMDSEDEYDHKQLSFAGISDVQTGIRIQIACDLRMPLTKIFGMSSAGFNSGEDDIENYNGMVESQVRSKSKFDLLWMLKIRCQQLFGFVPDDLEIEFAPLRVLSTEQQENVKEKQFNRLLQATQAGLMTAKEFKEACNKANLFPLKVDPDIEKLDTTGNEFGDENETEVEDRRSEEGFSRQAQLQEKAAKAEPAGKEKMSNSFDESKIKRDDDGQFSTKGGSSKKAKTAVKKKSSSAAAVKREPGKPVSEASEAAIKKVADQGFTFDVDTNDVEGDVGVAIKDASGKVVASAVFRPDGKGGASTHPYVQVKVEREARRKGLASGLYALFERETGMTLKPASSQTTMGKSIWDNPNRPFGGKDVE